MLLPFHLKIDNKIDTLGIIEIKKSRNKNEYLRFCLGGKWTFSIEINEQNVLNKNKLGLLMEAFFVWINETYLSEDDIKSILIKELSNIPKEELSTKGIIIVDESLQCNPEVINLNGIDLILSLINGYLRIGVWMDINNLLKKKISFKYRNYKGIISVRTVIPREIIFSSNEYHKKEQWMILAYDIDKQADRTFTLVDI